MPGKRIDPRSAEEPEPPAHQFEIHPGTEATNIVQYSLIPKTRRCVFEGVCVFSQATLERSEIETRQRLTVQVEKQEREISQLQKKLQHEVEQRHALERNHDVSSSNLQSLFGPP